MGKDTQKTTVLTSVPPVVREFSAGGVVFKKLKEDNKILWLVRKTSASELYPKQYWMLPKGRIDDTNDDKAGPMARGLIKADEASLQTAALREVREESGIDAEIVKKIGTSMYSFTDPKVGKILKFVTFYLMKYIKDLEEGPDWETEEVKWLAFEEAKKQLSFNGEKEILSKAQELLPL